MAKGICSVEDCGRPAKGRGWCNTHYERWRRLGDVKADMAVIERINCGNECSADDCERPADSRGWCITHYYRWRTHGDPLLGARTVPMGECSEPGCADSNQVQGMCRRHYKQRWHLQRKYANCKVPSLPGEQWLPVIGYDGFYEVSDQGRVRRLNHVGQPRRLLTLAVRDGRLFACLTTGGKSQTRQVSILVLEAFVAPRPPGLWGCHNDGNATNNRIENLRWDTPAANYRDMAKHGTNPMLSRTHCPRNHLLAAPNLRRDAIAKRGHRCCLACDSTWSAIATRRRRGLPLPDFREEADRRYAEIMGVKHDGGSPRRVAP